MTNENNNTPLPPEDDAQFQDNFIENGQESPAAETAPAPKDDRMNERLERLGGEPAPVITPEEFARLQRSGQVNIDARGRVRTARRASEANEGVSLRKRRAWYGA